MKKLRNEQSCEISAIPISEGDHFRSTILKECQKGARLVNLFGYLTAEQDICLVAVLGKDQEARLSLLAMVISKTNPVFKSLTPELAEAHWFEREIAEQFAVIPEGHPWLKPIRYHQNYRNVKGLWPEVSEKPIPGNYSFFHLEGEEVHEVGVGPVHAGIIEPGHFRFQCHGETILHLEIQLGYQHRGIEKLMEEVSLDRKVLLAESIAGDTVIGHAMAYCTAMEALTQCVISPRAQTLRAIALELERLANHTGDLGALSSDIGFLPAAAYFGRLRGEFLNMLMELTGSRYGRSFCRPGGVLFDIDLWMAEGFVKRLKLAKKDLNRISDLFFTKSSVLARLEGVGVVSNQTAKDLGLVGPASRASGLGRDVRTDYPFGVYGFHYMPVSTANAGDVFARAQVRWLESQRSIDFIMELLNQIPKGHLCVPAPLQQMQPNRLVVSMTEGWRGEIVHTLMTDAHSNIMRYKIKDPSFHNWMGLTMAVRGGQISDFPLCNKSFNLSYAGHDL